MARGYRTHYVQKFAKVKLSLIPLGAVKKILCHGRRRVMPSQYVPTIRFPQMQESSTVKGKLKKLLLVVKSRLLLSLVLVHFQYKVKYNYGKRFIF